MQPSPEKAEDVYESIEVDLDLIDVKAGGLVGYDAEGRLLQFITGTSTLLTMWVSITEEQ